MRKSNGSSFQSPVHWAIQRGTWDQDTQWLPGDFNRDGRDDLASVRQDGTGATFEVHLSTGSAFAASALWMYRDGTWDNGIKWDAGDFDGDQRDDILAVWNDGGSNTLTVRRSTGNNFQARSGRTATTPRSLFFRPTASISPASRSGRFATEAGLETKAAGARVTSTFCAGTFDAL